VPGVAMVSHRRMDVLVASLSAAYERWRADGATAELELRLGKRSGREFLANIPAAFFYATFQVLVDRATSVSATDVSRHSRFDVAPDVRREDALSSVPQSSAWTRKTHVAVHDCALASWFDARISLASETHVEPPTAVVRARALANNCENPLAQAATRTGFPSFIRMRHRRSLTFAEAPAWRLDCTRVEQSFLKRYDNDATGRAEYSYSSHKTDGDVLELELEYVGERTLPTHEVVDQARWLLALVASALGATREAIDARLERDRLAFEYRYISWRPVASNTPADVRIPLRPGVRHGVLDNRRANDARLSRDVSLSRVPRTTEVQHALAVVVGTSV